MAREKTQRESEAPVPLVSGSGQPWVRGANESVVAFAAFVMYRNLPVLERSLAAVAKARGRDLRLIERWSRRHSWVDRAQAFDDEEDRRYCESVLNRIRELEGEPHSSSPSSATLPTGARWLRQPEESAVAFAAFTVYRDLPVFERSLRAAADACGRHVTLIERWSRKYDWVARANAWFDEQDRVRRECRYNQIDRQVDASFQR